MVAYTLLAGGYSAFISTLLFTPATSPTANDASLQLLTTSEAGTNPSWLQLSPFNDNILYATNEAEQGALLSFNIDNKGALTRVGNESSAGSGPAYAAALTGPQGAALVDGVNVEAVVLNYGTGNGAFLKLNPDFLGFDSAKSQPITFEAPPGGVSHPHHSLQYGKEVLVVDLGADKIWRLAKSGPDAPYGVTGFIPSAVGSGPRRALISLDNDKKHVIYTLHEKANTLTAQLIPDVSSSTTLEQIPARESLSILPPRVSTEAAASYAGAELLMPEPNKAFPKEYLYASNRNVAPNANVTNPEGDAIAIFSTNPLTLVTHVFTGVNQVRGMEFFGEDNEFLIVGGLGGGGVAVFKRTGDGGGLELVARNREDGSLGRTGFAWAKRIMQEGRQDKANPVQLQAQVDPATHGNGGAKSFLNAGVTSVSRVGIQTMAAVAAVMSALLYML